MEDYAVLMAHENYCTWKIAGGKMALERLVDLCGFCQGKRGRDV
jgi:hypothetical protein